MKHIIHNHIMHHFDTTAKLNYYQLYNDFAKVCHRKEAADETKHLGITGNLLAWNTDFLLDHTQSVVVRGTFSGKIAVKFGVPQGTVLDPLLFLTYNDNNATFCEVKDCTIC